MKHTCGDNLLLAHFSPVAGHSVQSHSLLFFGLPSLLPFTIHPLCFGALVFPSPFLSLCQILYFCQASTLAYNKRQFFCFSISISHFFPSFRSKLTFFLHIGDKMWWCSLTFHWFSVAATCIAVMRSSSAGVTLAAGASALLEVMRRTTATRHSLSRLSSLEHPHTTMAV